MTDSAIQQRKAKSIIPVRSSFDITVKGITPVASYWILRFISQGHDFDQSDWHRKSSLRKLFKSKNMKQTYEEGYAKQMEKFTSDAEVILTSFESEFTEFFKDPVFESNLKLLGISLNLNKVDIEILSFAITINSDPILKEFIQSVSYNFTGCNYTIVAETLGIGADDFARAFSDEGQLKRTGLLETQQIPYPLWNLFEVPDGLLNSIKLETFSIADTLKGYVLPSLEGTLNFEDYPALNEFIRNSIRYLDIAQATQRKGVNILLYGPPGSGKTELARLLAKESRMPLFEVSSCKEQHAVTGAARFRHYWLAQNIMRQTKNAFLFDEVEDVFDVRFDHRGREESLSNRKSWVNQILETNPIPTIWITNQIDQLDPAYIRRFDLICEVPYPSFKQRQRMLEKDYSDILSPDMIQKLAKVEKLAPAIMSRAASVTRTITDSGDIPQAEKNFESLLSETLKAQGHGAIGRGDASLTVGFYDPSVVNCDSPLETLADGLCASKSGRVCLFGPPGTGKTAFARWLADRIGIPLYAKRASDLMGMYVGQTEQNIAQAFKEASDDGALLLIDEVDSFLQDRRNAERNWEVSHVNELLIQMEMFNGIFIASTNLMCSLDQAALRRFDLKVKFDFLKPEQAESIYVRHCEGLGFEPPEEIQIARIRRMDRLTPGDFAAVIRQNRFKRMLNPEAMLTALESEASLKEGAKGTIGFIR